MELVSISQEKEKSKKSELQHASCSFNDLMTPHLKVRNHWSELHLSLVLLDLFLRTVSYHG